MNYTNLKPETLVSLLSICASYSHKERDNGHAWRFLFANGYGASIVKHDGSCGSDEDLWEAAFLRRENDDWNLAWDETGRIVEFTLDGICAGLSEDDVMDLVHRIGQL